MGPELSMPVIGQHYRRFRDEWLLEHPAETWRYHFNQIQPQQITIWQRPYLKDRFVHG
jgi:hypothetical protein